MHSAIDVYRRDSRYYTVEEKNWRVKEIDGEGDLDKAKGGRRSGFPAEWRVSQGGAEISVTKGI